MPQDTVLVTIPGYDEPVPLPAGMSKEAMKAAAKKLYLAKQQQPTIGAGPPSTPPTREPQADDRVVQLPDGRELRFPKNAPLADIAKALEAEEANPHRQTLAEMGTNLVASAPTLAGLGAAAFTGGASYLPAAVAGGVAAARDLGTGENPVTAAYDALGNAALFGLLPAASRVAANLPGLSTSRLAAAVKGGVGDFNIFGLSPGKALQAYRAGSLEAVEAGETAKKLKAAADLAATMTESRLKTAAPFKEADAAAKAAQEAEKRAAEIPHVREKTRARLEEEETFRAKQAAERAERQAAKAAQDQAAREIEIEHVRRLEEARQEARAKAQAVRDELNARMKALKKTESPTPAATPPPATRTTAQAGTGRQLDPVTGTSRARTIAKAGATSELDYLTGHAMVEAPEAERQLLARQRIALREIAAEKAAAEKAAAAAAAGEAERRAVVAQELTDLEAKLAAMAPNAKGRNTLEQAIAFRKALLQ